jgi:uncharacterized protein (TIGR02588 family)
MDKRQNKSGIPVLEWIFATAGAVIVVGMMTFNLVRAINDEEAPPDIQVAVEEQLKSSQGFLLQIKASNVGGTSAAGVVIEGTLSENGKELETSAVTFDYVPPHSGQKGGLFFTHDPKRYELQKP